MSEHRIPIRRALVSVYDKTGLEDLVRGLHEAGVELVSTGGSAKLIEGLGLPVTKVEDLTGFPECLDGRVKTLHPRVHAGILADRRLDTHVQQLADLGVEPFDLVVSNLYPFRETVALHQQGAASPDECVEQIDIGGPSMVRAAAKNHPSVAIVTAPDRYADVLAAVAAGGFTLEQRKGLAAEAFRHTAAYDVAVASWFASAYVPAEDGWPEFAGETWSKAAVLRYGENPHQGAALYTDNTGGAGGLAGAEQLHGKEMSYNNYVDTDAARRAAYDFDEPAVAIIKHANPCGIAVGADVAEAHRRAHECDPVSAFGGVIAVNRPVSVEMARQVAEVFTEVIVAPAYDEGAVEILQGKKNIRILRCADPVTGPATELRHISGGVLAQMRDQVDATGDDPTTWALASGEPASPEIARRPRVRVEGLPIGQRPTRSCSPRAAPRSASAVGPGQPRRLLPARGLGGRGSGPPARSPRPTRSSRSRTGPRILIDAGVTAIVQPGGSVRDELTIEAARAAGVTMYFTGTRHFAH